MVWFHKIFSAIAHIINVRNNWSFSSQNLIHMHYLEGFKRALYCVELHDVDQEIRCAKWLEVSQALICRMAACAVFREIEPLKELNVF